MRWQATLQSRLSESDLRKLLDLNNPSLNELIAISILRYQPKSVFISTGSEEDKHYVRTQALRLGEETPLLAPGHTVHYDGYFDQGRDPGNTKFCVKDVNSLGSGVLCIERDEGIVEINEIMDGIMHGKEMIVCFYSLGPVGTEFEIPCVQITDSYYVAHSEDVLYRNGYEAFKNPKYVDGFFGFIHSAGVLKNGVSRDIDFRRIFIDLETNFVYSANTQYAGNTVAAKKLAHRLAIKKAAQEDWLAEHLLIAAVPSYEGDKVTYITGAFPSWCGKTSTSMLFKIVGDDLAHLRRRDGLVYAANVEHGMFGVIKDVNSVDDPYIYDLLLKSGEIIFSNILDSDGRSYWQGMGDVQVPLRGHNHSGSWWRGKRDESGKPIAISHDNARFTVGLAEIVNFDTTQVVPCEGIIYGGRSAKRPVPVSQSYGWVHGVFYGATIESEPTAATVGGSGSRVIINPMANAEFLSIPIGRYLENHLRFGKDLKQAPKVFYVNYFLRDEAAKFFNTKMDKKVWVRWIERRINERVDAYATPIGFIPRYEDLAELFQKELGTAYHPEDYQQQFMIRVRQLWDKLDGVEKFYRGETSAVPGKIFAAIDISRRLLLEAERRHGSDIPPVKFKDARFPAELAGL